MSKPIIPSTFFVFAVVMHEDRFLVVREAKHGQSWYAPAGGLEEGESVDQACVRETWEEAHVLVEPTGIVRIDQEWSPPKREGERMSAWWRFVLTARPTGAFRVPKRTPDRHSLEARWATLREIATLPLRHREVLDVFMLVATRVDASRPTLIGPRTRELD